MKHTSIKIQCNGEEEEKKKHWNLKNLGRSVPSLVTTKVYQPSVVTTRVYQL